LGEGKGTGDLSPQAPHGKKKKEESKGGSKEAAFLLHVEEGWPAGQHGQRKKKGKGGIYGLILPFNIKGGKGEHKPIRKGKGLSSYANVGKEQSRPAFAQGGKKKKDIKRSPPTKNKQKEKRKTP